MNRKKLTLSVEERLTRRAKAIAKQRGTSVSRLVETFFTALEQEESGTGEADLAPERGEEPTPGESEGSSSPSYQPSDWARQWRGAFGEEGTTYLDDPSWEKEVVAEEVAKKHGS